MDLSPDRRARRTPLGAQDRRSPTQTYSQLPPSMPPTLASISESHNSHPDMAQITRSGAPPTAAPGQLDENCQIQTDALQRIRPAQEAATTMRMPSTHHRLSTSPSQSGARLADYRSREYPRAPPPARHRSRSPANDRPGSLMEVEATREPPSGRRGPSSSARRDLREPTHQQAPFQSANLYQLRQQRDPHRLLPTPVRPPRAYTFELTPADNEFLYTPPRTSQGEASSTNPAHPPQFQPVLRPVPGTFEALTPHQLGLAYAESEAFDGSRRAPEDLSDDPNERQEFARPFLYQYGVDYQSVEEELPSSPPLYDQFMVFEEGRGESREISGTIRQVSQSNYGDSSLLEIPGMWRS